MPKRGTKVAVLLRALGTHCSNLRKEVPCLKTDNRGGGAAPPKIAEKLNKPGVIGLESRALKVAGGQDL